MTWECALISFGAALNLTWAIFATVRSVQWRERYLELINKPFEFWQTREHGRQAMARMGQLFTMSDAPQVGDTAYVERADGKPVFTEPSDVFTYTEQPMRDAIGEPLMPPGIIEVHGNFYEDPGPWSSNKSVDEDDDDGA
jgi:hypothetical protein